MSTHIRLISILPTLFLLIVIGCDDTKNCTTDSDCKGIRLCQDSVCVAPPEDTQEDIQSDIHNDTNSVDTTETSEEIQPDTIDPAGICEEALQQLESCDFTSWPIENFGLNWPSCNPLNQCGAECLLSLSCQDLECDFNSDIMCDTVGPWYECWEDCQEQPNCSEDIDCNHFFDCCGGGFWVCTSDDYLIQDCERDCGAPPPPPACECSDGGCQISERSMCELGLERFRECGYTTEAIQEHFTVDYEIISSMESGECSPFQECYSRCIVFEENDTCMSCHFGQQMCLWDPFQSCVDACSELSLCESTGGTPDGRCHAPRCGESSLDDCEDSTEECGCPEHRPFWNDEWGCYDDPSCYPNDGSACRALGGSCNDYTTTCPDGYTAQENPELCDLGVCCVPGEGDCPEGPNVDFIAETQEECGPITFACEEGVTPFSDDCGCGCIWPTCVEQKFTTSGMADPFELDGRCEFLVLCLSEPVHGTLEQAIMRGFPEMECTTQIDYTCDGVPALASCIQYVEDLSREEYNSGCLLSNRTEMLRMVCAGDL